MSRFNWFHATVTCPHCGTVVRLAFQADVGVLKWDDFEIGDLVIKEVPLLPRTEKHARPIGPSLDIDVERPFWAAGLEECPNCKRNIHARIEICDRRFSRVQVSSTPLGLFDYGQISEGDGA